MPKLVDVPVHGVPLFPRRAQLWYDAAHLSSASGELIGYDSAVLFRWSPDRHLRVVGVVVVVLAARGPDADAMPALHLAARRAPWEPSIGVAWRELVGDLVGAWPLTCGVETDAGLLVQRPGIYARWDGAPLDVAPGGELAVRARLRHPAELVTSYDLAALLAFEEPSS